MQQEHPPRPHTTDVTDSPFQGGEELMVLGQTEGEPAQAAAALETALDLPKEPDTYLNRAWKFIKPWLIKEPVKGVVGKAGEERLQALHEQRSQLFQMVDRIRGNRLNAFLGREQAKQFEVTIKGNEYTLLQPLGAGAFGTTFEARNKATGEVVVVKCTTGIDRSSLNTDQGTPTTQARKAIMEIAAMKKLNGLHTPRLIDAQFVPDPANADHRMMVAVMEKVSGVSGVDEVFKFDVAKDDQAILLRIHTLLEAVQAVHEEGVLHLDLKPEHLFYSEDGTDISFIDYGIGHITKLAEKQSARQNSTSPHYAEPSRVKFGSPTFSPSVEREPSTKFDAFSVGRIIQTFLYKGNYASADDRILEFRNLPESLKQVSRIAEKMTVERTLNRLDLNQAIEAFLESYPQFARPEVATAQTA